MARILACTDGSIYAGSVIDHAAWAAARLGGAAVRVLHVLDRTPVEPPADRSGALGFDTSAELLRELADLDEARGKLALKRGRDLLAAAGQRLREAGVAEVSTVQRHGSLVDTVLEFEAEADLLVIGKRGEAADFAVGHLGANLERVLRSSMRPVLVASRAFRPIGRYAIAYDGSPFAARMVQQVAASAALDGLEGDLVMVAPPGTANGDALEAPAGILARAGRPVRPVLLRGETEPAISGHVAAAGIDLLVMGAYGHGRIRTMILGSTTTSLLRSCRIPVLVFR
jgi:nucleotide-binding universal stress UspA family protein